MCSRPLDHQFEGGVWLDIGEILFPQDGARAALNAKKLQDKQITDSLLERQTEELVLSLEIRTSAIPYQRLFASHSRNLRRFSTRGLKPSHLARGCHHHHHLLEVKFISG